VTATIQFTILGNPVPKGRPRFTRQGRTYTPAKTKTYEDQVAVLAKAVCPEPLKTPVAVLVTAVFPVPLTYPKKRREACLNGSERHIKRPDLDNIVKAVTDGMNGVVYGDDSQIVRLVANKVYGIEAMVQVTVQEVLQ